jgi:CRP-like cAMP-binding protein
VPVGAFEGYVERMRLRKGAKVKLLEQVPLFHDCSKSELARVAELAEELRVDDGGFIVRKGTVGHEFVVLVEGHADVVEDGSTIASVGAWDYIGEISLVGQTRRTASVIARGPVRALSIDEQAFHTLMAEIPSLRAKVNRAAFDRMAQEPPPESAPGPDAD